jgi:pimeloyl-ACP methyl ester carboxylesterase
MAIVGDRMHDNITRAGDVRPGAARDDGRMPNLNVGDTRLWYYDEGTGPPVVFVHGFAHSSRAWQQQRDFVSAHGRRALALDLRAHGRSEAVLAGHTVASYARDLRCLIQTLDLEGVVAVGHSLGASVIYSYCEQFGTDRLAGIASVGQGPTDFAWPDWPHGTVTLEVMQGYIALSQEAYADAAGPFLASLTKEPLPPAEHAAAIDTALRVPPAVATAILVDAVLTDFRSTIPKIDVPTLVCAGPHDVFTTLAVGEWLTKTLPAGRLAVFEHSGHCPFLEEPDRFNAVLGEFLDDVSPADRR